MVLILMGNGDTLRDENSFRLSEHCHKPKIIPKNYFRETKCMKKTEIRRSSSNCEHNFIKKSKIVKEDADKKDLRKA